VLFIGPESRRRGGEAADRWWRSTLTVFIIEAKGWELTGRPIEEGKRRRREQYFSSASRTQRRAAHQERRRRCRASKEEERASGGPMMGREAGEAWAGEGISTEKSSWAAKAFGPN
jgi:hypothetical protein